MSKFKSNFFDEPDQMAQAKTRAYDNSRTKRARLDLVRKFSNGLSTLSEAEAEEMNRTEITNHLTTYRSLQQQEGQFFSMVSGTKSLVEIIVDTDNAERDAVTGFQLSSVINEGAIHFKGKFANFWRKVAGELVIAGGAPAVNPRRYGWLPDIRPDMAFPPETELDSDKLTYAFDKTELQYSDLKKLEASVKDEKGSFHDLKNIRALIEIIEEQVKDNIRTTSNDTEDTQKSIRQEISQLKVNTIDAWWYYEVKYRESSGESYVSATLFTENLESVQGRFADDESRGKTVRVISYIEEAYESAQDWVHLLVIDSEIGGVKTLDTIRGVAELVYPSAVEIEELLNLMLEGDKMRAKPKFRIGQNAVADSLARWNAQVDMFAPEGVEEFELKGSTGGLQTPMSILSQNTAGLSAAPVSNSGRGGELRVQAQERQRAGDNLQGNRISDAYNHMECILENVVHRLLTMKLKPGTDGYLEAKWIRSKLEAMGIPYKGLAKRKFGRFEYIRVRANRILGNGDRIQTLEAGDWLMKNIQNYPPETRPLILQRATLAVTQDPDFTERAVTVPQIVINSQKITAENEFDTIRRRAILAQVLPIGSDDIDQDHVPIHLLDLQAMLALNQVRPWDRVDVMQFGGVVEHIGLHIQRMLSNPITNGEAKQFLQPFQQMVAEAEGIVETVQETEDAATNGIEPTEQARLELETAKLQLQAQKFGLEVETQNRLEQNRQSRASQSRRQQNAREVFEDRRLRIQEQQVLQKRNTPNTNASTN